MITAIIVFHREGALAVPSILSFIRMVKATREHGLKVEAVAILDKADPTTKSLVELHSRDFDVISEVAFGDLGKTRNHAIEHAKGKYIACVDGDDLWGINWLTEAYRSCEIESRSIIYHPKLIWYFCADDYIGQQNGKRPEYSKSFAFIQVDSRHTAFDPKSLYFSNVWTANSFGLREIYVEYPYRAVNSDTGFGVEDWTWNAETLSSGIKHGVVEGTVHCVRIKSSGSLGQQNMRNGILPSVYKFADALE